MANLNKVFQIGNLTRDPELRYTPGGSAVANFGIATNRTYKTASGEKREDVCFVDVTAWAKQAELIKEHLRKGDPIFIEGRLQFESWEKDGVKRSKLSVVVVDFQFLGSRGQRQDERDDPTGFDKREPAAQATATTESGDEAAKEDLPF